MGDTLPDRDKAGTGEGAHLGSRPAPDHGPNRTPDPAADLADDLAANLASGAAVLHGVAAPDAHRPMAAAAWMVGSILSFSAMAIATRAVKDRHEVFEVLAYRSLVGLVLVVALAFALGRAGRIRARRLPGHLARNSVHFCGTALWFWAVTQIPLAQVFALEFTSPLWVILLSPLFLGERLRPARLAAAGLGFIGILLVAQPDFADPEPGVMAAAASAVFFAATMILTKRLTREEDLFSILFWLALIQSVFGLVLALHDGAMVLPDAQSAPWLALIGFCGIGAHLCLTRALSLAPASFVGPVDFMRLPIIALIGAAFYDEPLTLGLAFGAALILMANVWSLGFEKRSAGKPVL